MEILNLLYWLLITFVSIAIIILVGVIGLVAYVIHVIILKPESVTEYPEEL